MTKTQVIDILRNELGYIGKKNSTDNVMVKEAPNGKGKYNKYSRELATKDYYNTSKDGADYCCIIIDWIFYKAAGGDMARAVAAKPLYGYGKDKGWRCGAGCNYAYDAYPKDRRFDTPEPGDQIFYKCLDDKGKEIWAHTGLVVSVDPNGDVHTIEGNWGCSVVERIVRPGEKYSGQWIGGYCRPYYDAEEDDPKVDPVIPEGSIIVDKAEWDRLNNLLGELAQQNAVLKEELGIMSIRLADFQDARRDLFEAVKRLEELQ